jgi:two-component system, OmpR family, response regulator
MKVLVVDDDPVTLELVADTLREKGYAVDTAPDGEDALYKAQNWDYDAIVLDVIMPQVDGWEVLTRLRRTKKTPVLMLTSRGKIPDRIRGLDTGADDYLVKPFDVTELLARLRALIRRTTQHAHSVIEIGDIAIDLTGRTINRAGLPVHLSPREFAIVEHLALRVGRIVSRTALHEHLFAEDDDVLSNLVDVHVSKIRKKLGRDFIVTRPGHGYCIERITSK